MGCSASKQDRSFADASRKSEDEKTSARHKSTFTEVDYLLTVPFFRDLSSKNLRVLRDIFTRRTFQAGEYILREGQKDSVFHVLVSGRVKISAKNHHGADVELSDLKQGDWFGDMALLHDDFSPVSARVVETATVLMLSHEQFYRTLRDYPELGVSIDALDVQPPLTIRLKAIPFFNDIDDLKLQALGSLCTLRKASVGQQICKQGDEADGFYYIVSGRVDVSAVGEDELAPPISSSVSSASSASASSSASSASAASSSSVAASNNKLTRNAIHLATLKAGEWFGEIALLESTRRTATVTTTQDCLLLFLSRERFDRFCELAPELRESKAFVQSIRRRTANSLRAIPIFAGLRKKQIGPLQQYDEEKLALLGELFRWEQVTSGSTIFKEGDPAEGFYIVVRGRCVVSAARPDGSAAVVGEIGVNDFFGETSLLFKTRCNATIVAKTNCVLLRLLPQHFQDFLRLCPEIQSVFHSRVSLRTANRLAHIPFFNAVKENKPWSKLDLLGGLFVFEEVMAGQVVFHEGDLGDKFYVVVSGELKVTMQRDDQEKLLDVLREDSWFGEIALIKNTFRTATITASKPCVLLSITSDKFHAFLTVAPELSAPFQAMLEHRTANLLRTVDLFRERLVENRPWSKLSLLASMFKYDCLLPGDVLVRQGELYHPSLPSQIKMGDDELKQSSKNQESVSPPRFYVVYSGKVLRRDGAWSPDECELGEGLSQEVEVEVKAEADEKQQQREQEREHKSESVEEDEKQHKAVDDEDIKLDLDLDLDLDASSPSRSATPPLTRRTSLESRPPSLRVKPDPTKGDVVLGSQQHFGEVSVLRPGVPSRYTYVCMENVLLLYITQKAFKRFIKVAPELHDYFNDIIVRETGEPVDFAALTTGIDEFDEEETRRQGQEEQRRRSRLSRASSSAMAPFLSSSPPSSSSFSLSSRATLSLSGHKASNQNKFKTMPNSWFSKIPESETPSQPVVVVPSSSSSSSSSAAFSPSRSRSPSVNDEAIASRSRSSTASTTNAPMHYRVTHSSPISVNVNSPPQNRFQRSDSSTSVTSPGHSRHYSTSQSRHRSTSTSYHQRSSSQLPRSPSSAAFVSASAISSPSSSSSTSVASASSVSPAQSPASEVAESSQSEVPVAWAAPASTQD